jgi:uncharacterized membrane protein YozB (DUF420 family)
MKTCYDINMCRNREKISKQKLFTIISKSGGIALLAAVFSLLSFIPTYATRLSLQSGIQAARGTGVATDLFGNNGIVTTVTNSLLFVVGTLSVVMIIVGGLRYVVSGGNSTSVTGAKNTILYAVVGLIVAFLAYAAINFITNILSGGVTAGTNV